MKYLFTYAVAIYGAFRALESVEIGLLFLIVAICLHTNYKVREE